MNSENGYSSLFLPPPAIEPLKRLAVEDGLLLNAQRWQCAHEYHRHRQNLHYQAINQPGIVCGLGVSVIPAPADVAAQFRDGRWLLIQSGIAINLVGNPIVIPESIDFRIVSEAKEKPLTVYIVASYVDPDKLQYQGPRDIVQETFRIDEKTSPPNDLEVELCRIVLQPGNVQLENTTNVFFPSVNQLDLRYRQQAKAKPSGMMRLGFVPQGDSEEDNKTVNNLSYLAQSVAGLYPDLSVSNVIDAVDWQLNIGKNYGLIYLNYQQLLTLSEAQIENITEYCATGGILFVELFWKNSGIDELSSTQQELQAAIAEIQTDDDLIETRQQLEAELEAVTTNLNVEISEIEHKLSNLARLIDMKIVGNSGSLSFSHPLRNQPFLFGEFPLIKQQPIKLFNWDGIVLTVGELSTAWGLDEKLLLTRENIRSAQELGINILHFAYRRRQLVQLQQ